ncbi:hypothetical protein JQR85_18580 [Stutzerimonas urumqiensis]|uniref:hypothetical protein n=1 Tax=Stutzerimonas urumqiensis TaxID=638269 RepID=UPI003DA224A5
MLAMFLLFGFVIWSFGRSAFLGPDYRLCLARRESLQVRRSQLAGEAFAFILGVSLRRFERRAFRGPNYRLCLARRESLQVRRSQLAGEAFAFILGVSLRRFERRAFLGPAYRLRLARRVTFANRGKSNQNRLPLHPAPAAPGSPRSGAIPGARHEGPSMALAALAASLPLNPLHDTCARPADGASGVG